MTEDAAPLCNNTATTKQRLLPEVDSDFLLRISDILDAKLCPIQDKLSLLDQKVESLSDRRTAKWDTKPKPDSFWNEAIARVRRTVSKYGYVNSQILKDKDSWFDIQPEFIHSSQVGRLFARVVKEGDFVRFRLDEGDRAAWYLTRKDWEVQARSKASTDKVKGSCGTVAWAIREIISEEIKNELAEVKA